MTLRERAGSGEPTHRLVTRSLPGVRDSDDAGRVTAENRVVDILLEYGSAVNLRIDPKHGQFETVRSELARVPESEQVLAGSGREFRASLPADRPLVESVLELPADATDAWVDRTFSLEAFAILTEESWLYYSVPHETHIRECNASERDELVATLNEALEQVPGSAVVPVDGVTSWTTDGARYELTWDRLKRNPDANGSVAYDLERLQRVRVGTTEPALRFDWRPASAESVPRRAWWWLRDSEAARPPTRVRVLDSARAREILDAFDRLRSSLEYSYEVGDSDSR
ncbi:hypothetical protein EL22_07435 [Halostagnicola sp. A56]|uniref:hypothetical protein n=1 Tax=Halostagnicola sp. A56 TaxID=1495067 RepID=UPI00049FE331|nr:hypothetical protein [Halostagnicola sp. A56]KDE58067.1 hypothetical protein EL22_07435 [Halostagnicola sp. A56]